VHALLPGLVHPEVEVLVVDNASAAAPDVRTSNARLVALRANIGWAGGCNTGASEAQGSALAFVNPDCRPSAADLLQLAGALEDPRVGAVAPRFVDDTGSPQPFYFRFPGPVAGLFCFLPTGQRIDQWLGRPFIRHRSYGDGRELPRDVDQPGAACLVVRRDDFISMGGFDEHMFLFFADTDFCRRLRDRGHVVQVDWDLPVTHVGGVSVRQLPQWQLRAHLQRDYVVYLRKHHSRLAVVATKVAAAVLSGLLPALWHVLRLRPRSAGQQLRVAMRVVTA
jgi:GT2 family glycosyltransferase